MNTTKSTYISFEQAKWLKWMGFNEKPSHIELDTDYITGYVDYEEDGNYVITDFQFKDHIRSFSYLKPEQWQVIEWLMVNFGIWIEVKCPDMPNTGWYFSIHKYYKFGNFYNGEELYYNSPQEAYSAAFDYIKNEGLCANYVIPQN
jgi:hypothetical protein